MPFNDNFIFRCYYCERVLGVAPYGSDRTLLPTIDHIIPVSCGGSNNHINLVPCCNFCNGAKGNLSLDFFIDNLKAALKKKRDYKGIPVSRLQIVINNAQTLINAGFLNIKEEIVSKFLKTFRKKKPNKIPFLFSEILTEKDQISIIHRKQKFDQAAQKQYEQRLKNNIDDPVKRLLSEPEPNFHYE